MNCVNHPDVAAAAYCQFCGKPLCKDCVRNVGGVVYCESCLAARVGAIPGAYPPGAGAIPGIPMQPGPGPNPALAGLLGIIPGVGAMYNGQLVKGLAHVFIFAVLVSLSHSAGVFGIFVAAWVIYQIFDAYHTARARRDGLPLPDPFGLNDLGHRLGLQSNPFASPGVPPAASAYTPSGSTVDPTAAGFVPPTPPPHAGSAQEAYGAPTTPYAYTAVPVPPVPPLRSDLPTGAIILIALGVLFLLGTMGVLNGDWVGRGWPVIIIGIGIWLFIRRSRELQARQHNAPPNGPGTGGGLQ